MLLLEKVEECIGVAAYELNPAIVYINLSDDDALLIAATHNADTHFVAGLTYYEKVRLCRTLFVERGLLDMIEEVKSLKRGMMCVFQLTDCVLLYDIVWAGDKNYDAMQKKLLSAKNEYCASISAPMVMLSHNNANTRTYLTILFLCRTRTVTAVQLLCTRRILAVLPETSCWLGFPLLHGSTFPRSARSFPKSNSRFRR